MSHLDFSGLVHLHCTLCHSLKQCLFSPKYTSNAACVFQVCIVLKFEQKPMKLFDLLLIPNSIASPSFLVSILFIILLSLSVCNTHNNSFPLLSSVIHRRSIKGSKSFHLFKAQPKFSASATKLCLVIVAPFVMSIYNNCFISK